MMSRPCAVAGMFYPKDPARLGHLLGGFFNGTGPAKNATKGIVCPHAGYVYSGQIAAQAFSTISPDFSGTFVVIGPSHNGYLTCASAIAWDTPIGTIETDEEFVTELDIPVDEMAQITEHSIEVQLPFIRYRFPKAKIAPVMMGEQDPAHAMAVAEKIVAAHRMTKRDIRIVASSDFSHYVPEKVARDGDLYAIQAVENLDVPEFYRRIREKRLTVCGYGPISAMITACLHMGAEKGELIRYGTSGDASGDRDAVVGYAAIAVM